MIDKVDELIISTLTENSRQKVFEIWDFLRGHNYNLTEEDIESRISKLEENGVIKGYTIAVDIKKMPHRVVRVDLVTFRTSQALPKRLDGLKKYLDDAHLCYFQEELAGDMIGLQ